MPIRNYTIIDRIITQFDRSLQATFGQVTALRPNPADAVSNNPHTDMSEKQRRHSAALMRINHCGEICAQALYDAQGLRSKNPKVKQLLENAGKEEIDHLAWTHQRLQELKSHRSYLGLAWYWSSFLIGYLAAGRGDALSLGFVEETEHQVGAHLAGHLKQLQGIDPKSVSIIEAMQADEAKHAHSAHQEGAKQLSPITKTLMRLQAKVMTSLTYWV
jgi:ubiquinone biosynthesis monooxygenase Coq7